MTHDYVYQMCYLRYLWEENYGLDMSSNGKSHSPKPHWALLMLSPNDQVISKYHSLTLSYAGNNCAKFKLPVRNIFCSGVFKGLWAQKSPFL